MRARDVPAQKISSAIEFCRGPMSEQFKAWRTLRDTDFVTMRMSELGHLMAWYAELMMEEKCAVTYLRLPEPLSNVSEVAADLGFTPKELVASAAELKDPK